MSVGADMSWTASVYKTVNTAVAVPAGLVAKVLSADPRRYWVLIRPGGFVVADTIILPGPVLTGFSTTGLAAETIESKWKDAPSVTAGEWYIYGGAGMVLIVTECLYVGD